MMLNIHNIYVLDAFVFFVVVVVVVFVSVWVKNNLAPVFIIFFLLLVIMLAVFLPPCHGLIFMATPFFGTALRNSVTFYSDHLVTTS